MVNCGVERKITNALQKYFDLARGYKTVGIVVILTFMIKKSCILDLS